MEPEEPAVELYDFLYRDSTRIASYYAQLFGGKLTSLEETETSRDSVDKSGGLSLHVISGGLKSGQEDAASTRRTIDPSDIIATDVLTSLREREQLNKNVEDAPHGSLVIAKGTIVFVDRSILTLADLVFEMEIVNKRKAARSQAERLEVASLEFIRKFLAKIELPSGFLLHTEDGLQLAGTIKDSGMEEPISTYYFKHGSAGLTDVYLVGIKEVPTLSFTLPNTQLIGAGQLAVQGLADMMFPPGSTKVTPIALFRRI